MIYFLSETPTQAQQKQWIQRRYMWTRQTVQKDITFENENKTQKKNRTRGEKQLWATNLGENGKILPWGK
jgi:hypothetical protein